MAKSSQPSVLVRLQESLNRGNSTPEEFLLWTLKTPHKLWAYPFRKEIFVAFTVHRHVYTFLNLRTQALQYAVYIIGQPF